MPELPEVETVRAGLQRWVAGRRVAAVDVTHPRAVRRHPGGPADLAASLTGATFQSAVRRGKYLWLPLLDRGDSRGNIGDRVNRGNRGDHPADGEAGAPPARCLVAHLGMSGQLLVQPVGSPDERHLHVRIRFADEGPELRFVDQRTFGGLMLDSLVPAIDGHGDAVPAQVAHIARDPMDPAFDDATFTTRLRRRDSAVKRALLDQTLISGVGNIYADEALWGAGLHGGRRGSSLARTQVATLLAEVRSVLAAALKAGGTSFDALYVNVNGQSGYFDRSLAVYGRAGEPCPRCGTAVRRIAFMNRSSYFCPSCQRPPRIPRRD